MNDIKMKYNEITESFEIDDSNASQTDGLKNTHCNQLDRTFYVRDDDGKFKKMTHATDTFNYNKRAFELLLKQYRW